MHAVVRKQLPTYVKVVDGGGLVTQDLLTSSVGGEEGFLGASRTERERKSRQKCTKNIIEDVCIKITMAQGEKQQTKSSRVLKSTTTAVYNEAVMFLFNTTKKEVDSTKITISVHDMQRARGPVLVAVKSSHDPKLSSAFLALASLTSEGQLSPLFTFFVALTS
ncbi:C2 domain protein [Ancylostoma caninum]|uniref:C2 domain protein n=1 Tax=Ancylostoma caninum TaxID=29170 RepID=A0A368G9J9_ANCCA|nr:C2 domain protein [Ancylostoma caninum]